jgi:ligand-binding SRPBCC domain-containing protein
MRVHTLEREQVLPVQPGEAFQFFADAHNLEAITPPWLRFQVVTPPPIPMRPGTQIEYRLRLHGVPLGWLSRIEIWEPGRRFADLQVRGPYRLWHHTHSFTPHERGTSMSDLVRYALPIPGVGRFVRRDLERIFDYRRDAVAARLA